jgi:hypothetical protein
MRSNRYHCNAVKVLWILRDNIYDYVFTILDLRLQVSRILHRVASLT